MEKPKAAWHRAYYHSNPAKLLRPWDYRKSLEKAYRRVLKHQSDELASLLNAAQTVVDRAIRKEKRGIRSKILRSLRRRFQNAFRYGINFSKTVRELSGCSLQELRQHLENQWKPGMTWDNYGFNGWHIDHKLPCAAFNLSDPAQQKLCFHYSNLQPLWATDNFLKRDKILMPSPLATGPRHEALVANNLPISLPDFVRLVGNNTLL